MVVNVKIWDIWDDFYVGFMLCCLFWIQVYRKLYFTNLANPKNPNLNLDSTDYGCEIHHLLSFSWLSCTECCVTFGVMLKSGEFMLSMCPRF